MLQPYSDMEGHRNIGTRTCKSDPPCHDKSGVGESAAGGKRLRVNGVVVIPSCF